MKELKLRILCISIVLVFIIIVLLLLNEYLNKYSFTSPEYIEYTNIEESSDVIESNTISSNSYERYVTPSNEEMLVADYIINTNVVQDILKQYYNYEFDIVPLNSLKDTENGTITHTFCLHNTDAILSLQFNRDELVDVTVENKYDKSFPIVVFKNGIVDDVVRASRVYNYLSRAGYDFAITDYIIGDGEVKVYDVYGNVVDIIDIK